MAPYGNISQCICSDTKQIPMLHAEPFSRHMHMLSSCYCAFLIHELICQLQSLTKSGHVCRMTAWSPLRSIQSLSKFFLISGTATVTAWYAHPHLLNLAAHVLNLDFKDNVTAFQTSFFSFLSLVFAIYSGNTMAFLYDVRSALAPNRYLLTAHPNCEDQFLCKGRDRYVLISWPDELCCVCYSVRRRS